MLIGLFIGAGDVIFKKLGRNPPSFLNTIKDKKVMIFFAIFLLGNSLNTMISAETKFDLIQDG